jgi:OmcA/MtrC family decaheme c-type cytochrome
VQGEVEFDLSIRGAHLVPTDSASLPGVVIDLVSATGKAGEKAVVTYTAQDKAGNPIAPSELNRLRLYLNGPTSDYVTDAIREDAGDAPGALGGQYTYTFEEPIPADATGSWAVSVEARQTVNLLPGTVKEMEVRDIAYNDTVYFSVDGSPVEPRREIVDVTKCNACHSSLGLHGGNRNNTELCVMCHRPDAVGEGEDETVETAIDLRMMVHRIHSGAELEQPYFIGGNDYSHVEYPGNRNNCSGCHVNDSQQLPLGRDLSPVTDPSGWLNPIGPEAAACTACHSSIQAASHALANTSALGESCAACHGPGKMASVDKVHAE